MKCVKGALSSILTSTPADLNHLAEIQARTEQQMLAKPSENSNIIYAMDMFCKYKQRRSSQQHVCTIISNDSTRRNNSNDDSMKKQLDYIINTWINFWPLSW